MSGRIRTRASFAVVLLGLAAAFVAAVCPGAAEPPTAAAASAEPAVYKISANIDGRSNLILEGHTAYWRHFDYAAPGRWQGGDQPTVINGRSCQPKWPEEGENRDCHCDSKRFGPLSPPVPKSGQMSFTAVSCRGPCKADFTGGRLTIHFNDDDTPDPANYSVRVEIGEPLLEGWVRDSGGAPLAAKRVAIKGEGKTYHATSGASGHYSKRLARGTYRVEAPKGAGSVGKCDGRREPHACVVKLTDTAEASFVKLPYQLDVRHVHQHGSGPASTETLDDVWVADTLQILGHLWNLEGGPVKLTWTGEERSEKIASVAPAAPSAGFLGGDFEHDFTVPSWDNGRCKATLTAEQKDAGVERSAKLAGPHAARVFYADNAKVLGGERKLKADEFLCAGEAPDLPWHADRKGAFALRVLAPEALVTPFPVQCSGLWLYAKGRGEHTDSCGVYADTVVFAGGRIHGPTVQISAYDPSGKPGLQIAPDYLDNPTLNGYWKYDDPGNPTLNVAGDLNLDGALLWVKQNLNVGGAITGVGAVVVGQNISVREGARHRTDADGGVALASGGKIVLGHP